MSSGQDLNSNQTALPKVGNQPDRKYPRRLTPKRKELAREFIMETFHKYGLAQVWTPEWQVEFLNFIDPTARYELHRSDVAKWVDKYFNFFKQVFEEVASQTGTPEGIGSPAASYGTSSTDSSMASVPSVNPNKGASAVAQKPCLPHSTHQGQERNQQEVNYDNDLVVLGNSLEETLFILASDINVLPPTPSSLHLVIEIYNAVLENCKNAGVFPQDMATSYSTLGALLRLQAFSTCPLFKTEVPSSTSSSEMEVDASTLDDEKDEAQS